MPFGLIQSKLVTENQGNAIGEQLRAARLDQGISFEQLVTRTKIRRHFLESLEKGDHGQLPSSLCAINFLRQYSDALGLNTDKLVKAFRDSTSNLDGKPARYVDDVKIGGGGIPFKKALSRTAGAGKDFAGRRSNLVIASRSDRGGLHRLVGPSAGRPGNSKPPPIRPPARNAARPHSLLSVHPMRQINPLAPEPQPRSPPQMEPKWTSRWNGRPVRSNQPGRPVST